MTTKYTQVSLPDIFVDCQDMFLIYNSTFFSLFANYIDISDFIPPEFYSAFYKTLGRKRKYPLTAFLAAFLFKKIVSIPTGSLLIILFTYLQRIKEFLWIF